ncbi:MAG: histidine triad nucleotide-binding protein [Oligoflexales bacterium]|nr:histidine triad nucleotide-binding protein [Oligoflexales bacterium]
MGKSKTDTIFDKIIRKEIPSKIVFENAHVLAFHDISPQAPVHVLVVPKKKLRGFAELAGVDPMEVGHFIQGVALAAKHLGLDEDGYRIVFNYGKDALQTVDYIHAHILGKRSMGWPPG